MQDLTAAPHLDLLAAALSGTVHTPADDTYDEARTAWNLAVDQRPAAVVTAADAADIASTVRHAAEHGLRVAPQATGHGAGALGPLDDALLLRTDALRDVTIDPVARTARVAAGAQWNDVLAAAAPHGLAPLAGSAGDVGVIGYHLGGGMSFLGRKFGVAARGIRSARVVLASGEEISADPELLWALGGGSGAFGVVTELEIALHPAPELSAGQLFWPIERAREVLGAWRDWCRTAPDEITTSARFLRFPPFPEIPEPLRGGAFFVIDGAFIGSSDECEAALAPLRALAPAMDLFGPAAITDLTALHMDPPSPVPVASAHAMLTELDDALIDRLVALAGADSGTSLLAVELRQLGGELARGAGERVIGAVTEPFALFAVAVPGGPAPVEAIDRDLAAVIEATASVRSGSTFPNFVEQPDADAPRPREIADRLGALAASLDPAGLIVASHAPARD